MNDMHLRLYQVSLNGQLTFSDIDAVKAQLSKDYNRVESDFDQWFTDEETILKKNATYRDAENFARYFEKLGLEIKITKMTSTFIAVTPLQYISANVQNQYLNHAGFLPRFLAYFFDKIIGSLPFIVGRA